MKAILGEQGQSLLELLASLMTVAVTFGAAGWLLKLEWDRGKCAYVVFERTHAQVANTDPPLIPSWYSAPVEVHDFPNSVQGNSQCGASSESVTLPKLDPDIGL